MLKNYFKIAWRNLISNKVSSVINIGGLAIGMAVSFMLLLYVQNEYSFDKFHHHSDRLYQVFKNQPSNGEIKTKNITPRPLAEAIRKELPEVESTARMSEPMYVLIEHNERALKLTSAAVDPAFLQQFDLDFVSGNRLSALSDPKSIILSASGAKALFGNADPIGQTVKYSGTPMQVSAVIKDHPKNSSSVFKVLIPWDAFMAQQPWLKDTDWDNYSYYTYALLKPGASVQNANARLKDIIGRYFEKDKAIKLFMYPYSDLHLHGEFKNGVNAGGRIAYVKLFLFLAIGILLIACINFMNLSTARSQRRAREVGIRKAMGSSRAALVRQFIGESVLMALLAFGLALILIVVLLPTFNNIIHINLSIPYTEPAAWLFALAITIFTGFAAGSYPALFLSSFNPVKVLKGQFAEIKTSIRPRQALVVLQFTFAICLIISSIFIYRQINFIANKSVGYNRDGLIEMAVDGIMFDKFENFRRDAITAGAIIDGAMISEPIGTVTGATWANTWPGQQPGEEKIPIDCFAATYHFLSTYQFKIAEGRDFDPSVRTDSTAVILNEAAVKLMRLKQPLGQTITWMGANRQIVGVVQDFVWGSPYEPVKPTIVGFMKDWVGNIGLRLNPNMPVSKSLTLLQSVYKKYNPAYPFEYKFTDDSFSKKFENEKLMGTMAVLFTCLAVSISCLGLFGLASFSAEQRRKEISIRKVLGAGTAVLWLKLSQEFVKLVVISFLIGAAISWYSMYQWLNQYTYHTNLNVWIFALTFVISIAICLLAVSWQAITAAVANPANNLRSE